LCIWNGIRVSVKDEMALNDKFSFTFIKKSFLLRNITGHISESCEALYNNLLIWNGIRVSVKDEMALDYKFLFTFIKNAFFLRNIT